MTHPNLLFIYTDEQAFNTLAAYGNEQIEMPNLNRLAQQSTVFARAYASQPVCTPSRSTLLTGLYPHTNGCTENNTALGSDSLCLPEMLPAGRYATGHFGKWHLGDELFAQHGFDEWISVEDIYSGLFSEGRDREATSSYHAFLIEQGLEPENGRRFGRDEACRLPEPYGKPAFLAREASRFIRAHQHDPFVLYVNFLEPHPPFFGPRDDQYDPASMPLPANFDAIAAADQSLKARVFAEAYREWGTSGLTLETPEAWQRLLANYWGLCSLVDTHVGTILDTLEACGLSDSTIVVFTSDHGDMMGSHRLVAKCVMFEEAVRVPLLIRLPGQRSGRRVETPVSQIDVVPTLLDLLAQPSPGHLQGTSLRTALETGEDRARDVFIEWNGHNTGILGEERGRHSIPPRLQESVSHAELDASIRDPVRTIITAEGWKLSYSPRGRHELYDLSSDPGETTNLYGKREQDASLVADLQGRIGRWQERTEDPVARAP